MSLFGSDSQMWLINRERLVLLGGPAAAVLQVAHPVVAQGVARHSTFRTDSLGRLQRTLEAVYTVAFGTEGEAARVRREIGVVHAKVRGQGYSAFDPEAQRWVLATLIAASVAMFERFVRPLEARAKDQFLAENRFFGQVFGPGAERLPSSWQEFECYWNETLHSPALGSLPECRQLAQAVVRPRAPWWMRPLSPIFESLAVEFLPPTLQERLGLAAPPVKDALWELLDRLLPWLLNKVPRTWRFAPHYLRALRRDGACLGACGGRPQERI